MSKRQLIQAAKEIGIVVIKARHSKDAESQGIHLLNPTVYELQDALLTAERDMFTRVVLHTSRTWPYAEAKAA